MIEVELDSSIDPHSAEGRGALDAIGLCLGIGDIANAFHGFKIGRESSRYFGLMELTAREAGVIWQDFGWARWRAMRSLCRTSPSCRWDYHGRSTSARPLPRGRSCRRAVCPFLCLSICLFVCLFVCLCVCLWVCLSERRHAGRQAGGRAGKQAGSMFACLFVCQSVCLSVCQSKMGKKKTGALIVVCLVSCLG